MCGLNGIFAYNTAASPPDEAELLVTRDYMAKRGPDGVGSHWSRNRRCGIGHRRLSFLDLSDRARMPMISDDGQAVIAFVGEIYNFQELRDELIAKGRQFRTTSDTEVMLQLYQEQGPSMVARLRGMFTLAIWDEDKQGLLLARDPYGIKPLYYANDGWTFRFASQVKALLAGGAIPTTPDPAGTVGFLLFGSVPEPFTVYRDIHVLPAGCTQWIDAAGPREPVPYVNLASILSEAGAPPPPGEADERIRAAALDSVRAHMIADVEVGVFLSAGIDSGALLGLMRDAGHSKIRAITLGFDEFTGTSEDEAPLAAVVAAHYGAEHIVRRVDEREFTADLPAILHAMDQPSIDGVNTWFVSKAAREAGLKAALSGLGGDELLAGYPSFRDIPRWVGWLRAPGAVPGLGAAARILTNALAPSLGRRSPKLPAMLEYGGGYAGAYLLRRGLFLPFELKALLDPDLLREGLARLRPLQRIAQAMTPDPGSAVGRVCALESGAYMRNQLLRDSDWAGMAHSLEIRTPLVDITLLRTLAPIVPTLTPGQGKRALANAPTKPLPAVVAERAKTGFVVPTGAWRAHAAEKSGRPVSKGLTSRAWASEVLAQQQALAAGSPAVSTAKAA